MNDFPIDDAAVFQALPGGALLLTPDLVIADANEADTMPLQRYDVELPGRPGEFEERYRSPVNAPVLDADGQVRLIVHRVEEVTEIIRAGAAREDGGGRQRMTAELYARVQELQQLNDRLRQAHARERLVVPALQDTMLPAPRPVGHHRAAVRYRPAVGALNVCGDRYDLAELPGDRMAVAVGDVVGHGLEAACVMGQLRSALSAATLVTAGPARALEAVEFLDGATDPPLGARPGHVDRPEAQVSFADDAVLVLYTDGLIERRREDIDVGLARLAASLTRHRGAGAETLADALLAELLPSDGATDDTALVVIRLRPVRSPLGFAFSLPRLEQFLGPLEWLFVVSARIGTPRGTHRNVRFPAKQENAMRKIIGRSVAAAAIAAATVVPLAGVASAAPAKPAASSSGHDHYGRHHHRHHHHGCHHHHGFDRFGYGGFGNGYGNGFGYGNGYGNGYGHGFGPFGLGGLFGWF